MRPENMNDIFFPAVLGDSAVDPSSHERAASMHLTFSSLACPEWSLEKMIAVAVETGFSGIDFRGVGPQLDVTLLPAFDEKIEDTKAMLQRANLQVPCLHTSVTLATSEPEKWDAMLAEARRHAVLARRLGTTMLRVFAGRQPPELTAEQSLNLARRHVRQLVKICRPHGCRPVVETHDDWVRSERLIQLMEEIDPAEAGLLWDIEHPWRAGESPAYSVAALGKHLAHVHIKDGGARDGRNVPTLLGEGEVPVTAALAALRDANYQGWYCLEVEKRWHPDAPDPEVSLPQFTQFMRRYFEEK